MLEIGELCLLFLIPLWKMRRVVVNVNDPAGFIQYLRERHAR